MCLVGWLPKGVMQSLQGWSDGIDFVIARLGLNHIDLIWVSFPRLDVSMICLARGVAYHLTGRDCRLMVAVFRQSGKVGALSLPMVADGVLNEAWSAAYDNFVSLNNFWG